MTKIQFKTKLAPRKFNSERRRPADVLNIEGAPSARGNSFWKRIRGCPREHALWSLGIRRDGDAEALTQGLTFHHALEVYYGTLQAFQATRDPSDADFYTGGAAAAEAAAWEALAPMASEPNYEATYKEVERMLASYFDEYRGVDRWEVIAVEETLEVYSDDLDYSARLDLIVRDADRGGMWIVEHKTARALTETLLAGYQLDQQILGQMWLMRACVDLTAYPPLRGVLVNITTKHVKTQFARPEVLPSDAHLRAFEDSMRAHKEMLDLWARQGYPQMLGACAGPTHFFQKCDYFDFCYSRPARSVEEIKNMSTAQLPAGYVREDS